MKVHHAISACALAFCVSAGTSAAVISDTHITLNPSQIGPGYELNVFTDAAATDLTGFYFDLSAGVLSGMTTTVDSGSDWFLVSYNDVFSAGTIGNFSAVYRSADWPHPDFTVGLGDFYLGVNTGAGDVSPLDRDLFGWVHLGYRDGALVMLDNAMSYGGSGIVVGTVQEVPLPSSLSLILATAAASAAGLYLRGKPAGTRDEPA